MRARAILGGLLDLVAPPACAACDAPLAPGGEGLCAPCGALVERADGAPRAAFLYGGPLADAVRRFKYGGRSELAPVLARMARPAVLELAGRVDVVVSVPLHPRRERARGYDQTALLARAWARALAVPCRARALGRVRDTPPQASLDVGARDANVRAAFRVLASLPPRVLLVDDVRTTGATLAACGEALLAAGVVEVHPFVLARVEG
ncbi:MAG: ComF family protein [Sandaracinaceae bacterium]|nr:ComF family protein [Sandaracinaceae bacterium]